MKHLNERFCRQGALFLKHDTYACFVMGILTWFPFTSWLALSILCLITLRKGWQFGVKGLLVCLSVTGLSLSALPALEISMALAGVFFAYFAAILLRKTVHLNQTLNLLMMMLLASIAFVHYMMPYVIIEHSQFVQEGLRHLNMNGSSLGVFFNQFNEKGRPLLDDFIFGIQGVSVAFSAITALMLARSTQSHLFYPQAFAKELNTFRSSPWYVSVLLLAVLGAYHQYHIAISILPILVLYYAGAGLNVGFRYLTKGKKALRWFMLFLPLVMLPSVMLPIYALIGVLDGLFNFKTYLLPTRGR